MKTKISVLLIIVAACAALGLGQTPAKDAEPFKALIKQMTDAQIAFDTAAIDKLLTPDYIEISPIGDVDSREKVLSFYAPEKKPEAGKNSTSLEITDYSVRSYDTFAIVIARFNYKLVMDGKPLPPRSLRLTIVFKKEKGVWKFASTQYTGIRQMPAPAKPAVSN